MKNTFCVFLSNQYNFNFDKVKSCCWIKNTDVSVFDKQAVQEQKARLAEVTDWIPECSYCYNVEKKGIISPRQKGFDLVEFNDPDIQSGDPTKIEIQIDDTCNAACIMCGPWTSTTWREYNQKTLGGLTAAPPRVNLTNAIAAINDLIDFDKVKIIHFFGGEPFKTNTHIEILKSIKNPQNIIISYITNGSIFPDQPTLDLLLSFKGIKIFFSIDGTGDHFNYIRWPLQWNQVKENLWKFTNLKTDNKNFSISFTVNPFNIFYIKEYNEWVCDFLKDIPSVKPKFWFKKGHAATGIMNLRCIPPTLQQAIIEKYGIESYESRLMDKFDPTEYAKFMQYIEYHDAARKLDWKKIFPEIVEHFKI